MKPFLLLSLSVAALLQADDVLLDPVNVEGTTLTDICSDEIKSADLAEVLATEVPSITLVRRSGIANDIILRGQKRDNINVIVDGGKVYGACPNRMDPPTSHVITTNIDAVQVIEGPYDVEHAGTLSGLVNVETSKPVKGFHGNLNAGVGSFGYNKLAGTLTGGNDYVRVLVGASGESSKQYKDGDGNTFADQIDNAIAAGQAAPGNAFRDSDRTMKAYTKKSLMAKLFVNPAENHELRFGFTANRSDAILYPNTPMDAKYDNSDLYNVRYIADDLGSWSKKLELQYYYSYVDHPMWTAWRKASDPTFPANEDKTKIMTNHLESTVQGATLKNSADLTDSLVLTLGLDGSLRNWDGSYDMNGMPKGASIDDADTRNAAVFAELEKSYTRASVKLGLRYDDTEVTPGKETLPDNHYQSVGANLFSEYQLMPVLAFFGGVGTASRVPDARELYFEKDGVVIGTPDLKQTTNYEVDLGMKNSYDDFTLKTRVFYSMLKDYIYYNSSRSFHRFVNVDATIYGFELSGSWAMHDDLYLDFGAAYQRGEKDEPLDGQTNTNLTDVPPLKGNMALNWNYLDDSLATFEVVASDKWRDIDDENGEQVIDAWAVVNLKANHQISKNIGLIVGVDNLFDETYAVSNTYKDLTLLSVDPDADVMLMNEPGRYFYADLSYTF